jgi:Protein of unknown function (DUF3152)
VAALAVLAASLTSAALPSYAPGAGYRTVPGHSERAGSGESYRFRVLVHRSIRIDRRAVAEEIEAILFDRRSWIRSRAVAFRRVDRGGDTRVILAKPKEVDRLCYPLQTRGRFSCTVGRDVILNLRRWRNGVPHWDRSVATYRQMLVNHEVGHRIGHGHRNCPGRGRKAPVMQQQTISLQGCAANWWPKKRELRLTVGASVGAATTASRTPVVE